VQYETKMNGCCPCKDSETVRCTALFVGRIACKLPRRSRSLTWIFAVAFAAAAIFLVGPSKAARSQASFDGSWSVLIITDTGECDRAYRYGIRIRDGQIIYSGEAGVTFTGRVESNGQVKATVGRGEQSATGGGRLSGSTGAGTWKGRSNTGACGGRWEAERRSQ
jgi:hypothetical protein